MHVLIQYMHVYDSQNYLKSRPTQRCARMPRMPGSASKCFDSHYYILRPDLNTYGEWNFFFISLENRPASHVVFKQLAQQDYLVRSKSKTRSN